MLWNLFFIYLFLIQNWLKNEEITMKLKYEDHLFYAATGNVDTIENPTDKMYHLY